LLSGSFQRISNFFSCKKERFIQLFILKRVFETHVQINIVQIGEFLYLNFLSMRRTLDFHNSLRNNSSLIFIQLNKFSFIYECDVIRMIMKIIHEIKVFCLKN
jgi:hypothetical protein